MAWGRARGGRDSIGAPPIPFIRMNPSPVFYQYHSLGSVKGFSMPSPPYLYTYPEGALTLYSTGPLPLYVQCPGKGVDALLQGLQTVQAANPYLELSGSRDTPPSIFYPRMTPIISDQPDFSYALPYLSPIPIL